MAKIAKKKSKAKTSAKGSSASTTLPSDSGDQSGAVPRLLPPPDCVTVRMYRIGHGDCFLIAFATSDPKQPVYVLIDCGYKPGSPQYIDTTAAEICQHIVVATGGHVHVAVITHEHQDHVNAISTKNFEGLTIGECWLAWTEDPEDDLANDLRKKFKDKLLGLMAARSRLAAAGDTRQAKRLDDFISFEFGGEEQDFDATQALRMLGAAGGGSMSANKTSMQVFKTLADDIRYLRPHDKIIALPGADDVRVFALGPPQDLALLKTLDPEGNEEFHSLATSSASAGNYFSAAVRGDAHSGGISPFARRFSIPLPDAVGDGQYGEFFTKRYGGDGVPPARLSPVRDKDEVDDNPAWRRIDNEWLYSAEQLALDMNSQTNNSSLVLAFELGKGGKVLLFAADAQRGNWLSWARSGWKDGQETVTAQDLLARTVLYKAGHHCSHNATLNGQATDTYANLSWMAQGDYGREFTSMITAVRKWAETQKGWDHPFAAIKKALLKKASGRVFQTDTDFETMAMPANGSQTEWKDFSSRTHGERLFFDYTVRV